MTKTNALDLVWLKANAKKIHFFGLGFIQIKINETYRVHFYTRKWNATIAPEDIHNHRYGFTSWVLKGTLFQETFSVIKSIAGDCTVTQETCNPENKQTFPKESCFVTAEQMHKLTAGSRYSTGPRSFHRVESYDAITLIQRLPYAYDTAEVVQLTDQTSVCPFSVKVPEEELWAEVERMIRD